MLVQFRSGLINIQTFPVYYYQLYLRIFMTLLMNTVL